MKIIKLFLLLSLMLCADFKLDIPQNIDVTELERIVKNGWDEDNKTLNDLIVSNAERVMPEILEKIKKPILKGIVTKEDTEPLPIMQLVRRDYWFIVAYGKYLEYKGHRSESLNLYLTGLEGLKNIDDESLLSLIYHLSIEMILVDAIEQNIIKNNNFEKIYLQEKLEKLLILDTSILCKALDNERLTMAKLLSRDVTITLKIRKYIGKISQEYNKKLCRLKTKKDFLNFEKELNIVQNKVNFAFTNWVDKKIIPSLNLNRDELIAVYIFLQAPPRSIFIQEVRESIKRNKKFLESLT